MAQKQLGMQWFHFYFTFAIFRTLGSLYGIGMGILLIPNVFGWLLLIDGLALFFIHIALFFGYRCNRCIGVYPHWMYTLSRASSWLMLSPIYIFLHNPYIKHRAYLFPPKNCTYTNDIHHINDTDDTEDADAFFKKPNTPSTDEKRNENTQQERSNTMPQPVRPIKLIGQEVTHRKYGNGRIIMQADDIVTVHFAERTADFLYPSAFLEEHLVIVPSREPENGSSEEAAQKETKVDIFEKIRNARKPSWVYRSAYADMDRDKRLRVGCLYDTSGQRIYDKGCDVFGWNRNLRGNFSMMKPMYAYRGAHGKSVWMLCHHQWIESPLKKRTASWWNTITEDAVYEEWENPTNDFYHDFSVRVTFAKNKSGYVYIGIFKPQEELIEAIDPADGKMKHIKVYRKIADDYTP